MVREYSGSHVHNRPGLAVRTAFPLNSAPLNLLAVVATTSFMAGAMCQGLLWTKFFMASTRDASVSFRLKRVRRSLSISIIVYVALATFLLILELVRRQQAASAQWLLASFLATSTAVLFLYASHKMASQLLCEKSLLARSLSRLPSLCVWGFRLMPVCGHKRTSYTIVLTYHPQAKVFACMTSSIKTLNIRTALSASRRSNNSEWRIGSILAHLESAAHMDMVHVWYPPYSTVHGRPLTVCVRRDTVCTLTAMEFEFTPLIITRPQPLASLRRSRGREIIRGVIQFFLW